MIGLIQNDTRYEYDLRSLILAFMLGEKIELTESVDSIYDFTLKAFYSENETILTLYKEGSQIGQTVLSGNYKEKKVFKNPLKRGVYRLLAEALEKELPWGTLTGIRPTKIVFDGFAQGKSKEQIVCEFQKEYAASKEKAALCAEVAEKEQKLLSRFSYQEGYSLYVGIPFCPSTCLYCSFTSYPIGTFQERVRPYLDAVLKEAAFVKSAYSKKKLQTLYIGGGTPTALSAYELEYLLCGLHQYFPLDDVMEITVEAGRPDSITKEKLDVLSKYGITRISINPQTMNDKTLKLIGRNHSVEEVRRKFYMAREAGFQNINMDMICGLPEEGMEEIKTTCHAIKELSPESFTVHSLAVKRSSQLNRMKDAYHFGATEEMISYAVQSAEDMKMEPYYLYRQKNIPGNLENIGFSLKSKECLYNILIMEELHDIMAIGAGTSSKLVNDKNHTITRIENLKDVIRYTARIDEMIQRKRIKMSGKQEW